jgi:hypothetical protein
VVLPDPGRRGEPHGARLGIDFEVVQRDRVRLLRRSRKTGGAANPSPLTFTRTVDRSGEMRPRQEFRGCVTWRESIRRKRSPLATGLGSQQGSGDLAGCRTFGNTPWAGWYPMTGLTFRRLASSYKQPNRALAALPSPESGLPTPGEVVRQWSEEFSVEPAMTCGLDPYECACVGPPREGVTAVQPTPGRRRLS